MCVVPTLCACAELFTELVKLVCTASKQKFQTLVPFPKIAEPLPTQQLSSAFSIKNSRQGTGVVIYKHRRSYVSPSEVEKKTTSFLQTRKMSHRQSSWMSSSVSRPTAFNSPTFTRLSDVKGRLSFRWDKHRLKFVSIVNYVSSREGDNWG